MNIIHRHSIDRDIRGTIDSHLRTQYIQSHSFLVQQTINSIRQKFDIWEQQVIGVQLYMAFMQASWYYEGHGYDYPAWVFNKYCPSINWISIEGDITEAHIELAKELKIHARDMIKLAKGV